MKKPSNIKTVRAKKTGLLLPGFKAITLFGTIYCRRQSDVDSINETENIDSVLKCHETIHVRQACNTNNSWILFYLKYMWQWIKNIPLITVSSHMIYKFIPFEIEAYANERDYKYPTENTQCSQWREYKKKLTLKQKKQYAREYKKSKMTFHDFVKENIVL